MFKKIALKKFLKLSIISLITTIAINYLGIVQAQSPVNNSLLKKYASSPQVTTVPLKQFNLKVDAKPIVPANLKQSKEPSEGSRAVISTDDRIPMTSNSYPWSAIGRVIGVSANGSGYQCTGALIEANIVLTNAHCIIDPDSHLLSRVVAFEPNLINGRLADESDRAFVTKAYYGTDFRMGRFPEPDDWAIVELDRNLGFKYGTLKWEPLPTSTLVQHQGDFAFIGYSSDFPQDNPGETAGVHLECSIVGEVDNVFTHTCDSTEGSSGGPILAIINDDVRIIGLNSAYIQNTQNREAVNFAVKVSRIIEQL